MLVITGFLILFVTGSVIGTPKDSSESCSLEKENICDDPHAVYKKCVNPCPLTCAEPYPKPCAQICRAGCECDSGFILTDIGGKCVRSNNCPEPECPKHAHYVQDYTGCIRTCANRFTDWDTAGACKPFTGCVCDRGYVRKYDDGSGPCIPENKCPEKGCKGDPNAMPADCPSPCPETCDNMNTDRTDMACPTVCDPKGCVCKKGYVLTELGGHCVKPEECPAGCNGDRNATWRECTSGCPLTCYDHEPRFCIAVCFPPGCACNNGYVLNASGLCIKPEDCPPPPECNGDPNASFNDCPSACPATCTKPNEGGPCIDMCMPPGCVCNQGYLLDENSGLCVTPENCPGGWPTCGGNETYTYCKSGCPTDYCPEDDGLYEIACDPIYPCRGGCVCQGGYLRLSYEDERCVLSSDCPPVECTRPNEVWDPNRTSCSRERCEDMSRTDCDYLYPLPPNCVCKEGYYRNLSNVCVPASECPCAIPDQCKSTCSVPNPPDCNYSPPNINIDGCSCMDGYILSDINGKCIKIENCPKGCDGDPHAITKQCPHPCPSTCQRPNAIHCRRACLKVGCECEPGYILSDETGQCILPDECPGGNPCGENAHFVACRTHCDVCPQNDDRDNKCYVPDPCLSGCVCDLNHKRKSYDDPQCILSSDCPPVTCTRPNEVWNSCPSACLAENCEDIHNQPTTCETLVLNCDPRCICKENHFRNASGICVCASDCP